ncbi:ParA family protein [Aerococcus urinaeequi]|uniref:ParA family protein n=1 Tax=Aerococcus urinaeequi TaxID=51665 RepID=UPI003D6B2D43
MLIAIITIDIKYKTGSTYDKKILCIDFSPQGDLSSILLNTHDYTGDKFHTISDVLFNDIEVDDAIQVLTDNLDLIPGDWELVNFNKHAFTTYKKNYQKSILKSVLNSIKSDYDFILIDTSTDMGLISDNALTASDGVIINSKPLHLGLMSTIKYAIFLNEKTLSAGYHFKILGTLFTHDNNKSSEVANENILQHENDLLPFSSSIYEDSEIRGMKSLNEVNNFEDYERLLIELNSKLNISKNSNKEYTFSLSPRTYKLLEKMSKHNGYEDIFEFLDIWIRAFNIERF